MSLIIAIKSGDTIFLGADTQSSTDTLKVNHLNEERFKLKKMPQDFIVGSVGLVIGGQTLAFHPEWFELPKSRLCDKRYIVENIINPFFKTLEVHNYDLKESAFGVKDLPGSFVIARQDKLFEIKASGSVIEVADCIAIGSGSEYAIPALRSALSVSSKERILLGLRIASKFDQAVSPPFILINTKTLEYEIVKEERG